MILIGLAGYLVVDSRSDLVWGAMVEFQTSIRASGVAQRDGVFWSSTVFQL